MRGSCLHNLRRDLRTHSLSASICWLSSRNLGAGQQQEINNLKRRKQKIRIGQRDRRETRRLTQSGRKRQKRKFSQQLNPVVRSRNSSSCCCSSRRLHLVRPNKPDSKAVCFSRVPVGPLVGVKNEPRELQVFVTAVRKRRKKKSIGGGGMGVWGALRLRRCFSSSRRAGKLRLGRLAAPIHELMKLQAEEDEVNAPGTELMSSYFIMSCAAPLRARSFMHAGM